MKQTNTKPRSKARPNVVRRVNLENFTLKDIPDVPTEIVLECLQEDEYGDGRLFAELFTGKCVFDHTSEQWYTWQGHYWKIDDVELIRHLVSGALASTYIKASAEINLWIARLEQEKEEKTTKQERDEREEKIERCKSLIKALNARSYVLKKVTRMRNVLIFASSYLAITSDKWDTVKWVLPTADGVIDLRTGTIRAGKPEEYIRTTIPTIWQGLNTECPRFERFLQEIFSDRNEQERTELIHFLHRALGYGIAGLASIHMFLMLYGDEGRNGKDTLMKIILKVLGDTVGAVSNDVLISAGRFATPGAAKPHLVSLQGKRIAWASETEKGERFAVGQVKFLTGGGTITARQLHAKEFSFEPSHLLFLLTNNKPHADAKDKAFWERVCPIIFNVRFVEAPDSTKAYERKADDKLIGALEAEASGILAWLVRGCLTWQKIGMNVPACVLKARAKYREEEDTLGLFISEDCVTADKCSVKSQLLYAKYCEWSDTNNLKTMSGTAFGTEISKTFKKVHTMNGNFYQGIGLQSDYPHLAIEQNTEQENTERQEQEPELQTSNNGYHIHAEPVKLVTGIID